MTVQVSPRNSVDGDILSQCQEVGRACYFRHPKPPLAAALAGNCAFKPNPIGTHVMVCV